MRTSTAQVRTREPCKLCFLVYLIDDFEGGETDFREFRVRPEAGKARVFVHDSWRKGCAVPTGTKYVLRSDVLFDAPAER